MIAVFTFPSFPGSLISPFAQAWHKITSFFVQTPLRRKVRNRMKD